MKSSTIGKELEMFVDQKEIGIGKLREMGPEISVRLLAEIDGEGTVSVH